VVKNSVISFTTRPEREELAVITAYSLLTQSVRAEHVIAWISRSEWKDRELSPLLEGMTRFGLEIRWVSGDARQFMKIWPAVLEFPESFVVTADDDRWYEPDWFSGLIENGARRGNCVMCDRPRRMIGFPNGSVTGIGTWWIHPCFDRPRRRYLMRTPRGARRIHWECEGWSGIVYPPGIAARLGRSAFNWSNGLVIARRSDDMWWWKHEVLAGVEIVPTDRFLWCTHYVFKISGKETSVLSTNLNVIDEDVARLLSPIQGVLAELYSKASRVDDLGL
jgi:hypothetical protein